MTWRWASAAVLVAAGALVPARGARAQRVRELGVQTTVLASDPAVVLGGGYGALRLSSRTRLALTASAGATDGAVAWRGEVIGHFLLNPRATARPGWYGGAGAAVAGARGNAEGYVVLLVGVEARPGARSGWAVEAGLGGGFRAAAGWRWRFGR